MSLVRDTCVLLRTDPALEHLRETLPDSLLLPSQPGPWWELLLSSSSSETPQCEWGAAHCLLPAIAAGHCCFNLHCACTRQRLPTALQCGFWKRVWTAVCRTKCPVALRPGGSNLLLQSYEKYRLLNHPQRF